MATITNARGAYPSAKEWGSKARKAESNHLRTSSRQAAISEAMADMLFGPDPSVRRQEAAA